MAGNHERNTTAAPVRFIGTGDAFGSTSRQVGLDRGFACRGRTLKIDELAPRVGVMHNRVRVRRGGRARFKAHAWNACRLERVSGVRIPPSPPYSLYYLPTIWRWGQIRAGCGGLALNANRRKPSRCRFAELRGVFSTRRKNGSLQGSNAFRSAFAHTSPLLKPAARRL